MITLSSFYIPEQPLIFYKENECNESQGGLFLYGPYGKYAETEPYPLIADIGIIGTSKSINNTTSFFAHLKKRIPAESTGRLDYPGLGIDGILRFELKFEEQWMEIIDSYEILEARELLTREERIHFFINSIEKKIISLYQKDPSPMVVIIALPIEIIDMCKKPGQQGHHITITHRRFSKTPNASQLKGDFDFHNIIKVIGMEYGLPTQLILPATLHITRKKGVQGLATRAWNLTVALYYKAQGTPWKIARLDHQTCYAGISFYRELDEAGNPSMRASVTHLFLHTGECLVLTGEPFKWKGSTIEPHLTKEQASAVKKLIIKGYTDTHGINPKRLVIYKRSNFTDDEINGFMKKDLEIKKIDLLTVKTSSIKWFREGDYPPLRGTVIKGPGPEFMIFTTGFIQEMNTYPKPGVPMPLHVIPYNLDSTELQMCKEILSLSKLNWNNINYSDLYPAPLSVSRKIGQILSESRARNIKINNQYRFYM